MNVQRKLTLVIATGAIALGAGHYVQEKAADRVGAELSDVVVTDIASVAAGPDDVAPRTPAITPPALPAEAAPTVPVEAQGDQLAAADPTAPEVPACAVNLEALAQPDAMIGISLLAPCHADQRIVLKHAGLAVTARTSGSGALVAVLPALTAVADIEVLFADGQRALASVPTSDFAGLQRFAVQWQDADAFQLHGFENGAGYGQPGHISSAGSGTSGATGYVTVLGDASVDLPLLAEVYTFGPAQSTELVLEAAITAGTCGREILGEAILAVKGAVEVSDLTLAMPGCEAVGDILVLKNLLEDMTLATAN